MLHFKKMMSDLNAKQLYIVKQKNQSTSKTHILVNDSKPALTRKRKT